MTSIVPSVAPAFLSKFNYGIAITFARWSFQIILKLFAIILQNHVRKIFDCWQWPSPDLFTILCKVSSRRVAWFKSVFWTYRQINMQTLSSMLRYINIFNVRQLYCARYSYRLDVCPSVRPSICPSHVGMPYCVETAQPIVKLSSLPGRLAPWF